MVEARKTLENIAPYETDFYKCEWRLKLDANENIYGCANSIVSLIKNIPTDEISLYPVYGNTIDKIAAKYNLNKNNILLTNGCDEALNIIVNTYLDCDDEILSYSPSFSMPSLYAKICGAKTRFVEYSEKYVFKKEDFINNIQAQTKIIYIATPNNPTGEIAKASTLEMLIKENKEILFILDCTYINFSYSAAFEDYIDLAKKYDNVVVVKSFSKDYAIAGLRLGLVLANEKIINNLKKVISPYSVNAVAIYCLNVLLNDEKRMEEIKELNNEAKELLFTELKRIGYNPYKSEANFILCDFSSHSDFYYEKLKRNGVIVRKYSKNSHLSTCLRITVPKIGGVKYIIELLNKKDLIIFNIDETLIDIKKSSLLAIKKTLEYFLKKEIAIDEIIEIKSHTEINSNWDCVRVILEKYGQNISMDEIINVFQNLYYNSKDNAKNYLIDNEELLIDKKTLEELSEKYDFAIFTNRFKDEVNYSFKKLGIDKYFYYFVTADDLPKNMLKPHPQGCYEIINHCPHKTIKYFASQIKDIISANTAGIEVVGIIPEIYNLNSMTNNYRHLGVKNIISDIKNIKNFLKEYEK